MAKRTYEVMDKFSVKQAIIDSYVAINSWHLMSIEGDRAAYIATCDKTIPISNGKAVAEKIIQEHNKEIRFVMEFLLKNHT